MYDLWVELGNRATPIRRVTVGGKRIAGFLDHCGRVASIIPRLIQYVYTYTWREHLQNLTGWSLTRETRCISISISSMVVVVIGLIASRRRHAKRLPDWTLLYQHRENFIAGHVSTVRISCSLGISICIAPREIACRAFSDRHVYLFHLTFSFFFFLTRGVAAFFNPFHRRRKEIADNHLGPASSNVYTKSNSF